MIGNGLINTTHIYCLEQDTRDQELQKRWPGAVPKHGVSGIGMDRSNGRPHLRENLVKPL